MLFYIFTRVNQVSAEWELIETAKVATNAQRAAAEYRQLCRDQGDVDVVTVIADMLESARQKLARDYPDK